MSKSAGKTSDPMGLSMEFLEVQEDVTFHDSTRRNTPVCSTPISQGLHPVRFVLPSQEEMLSPQFWFATATWNLRGGCIPHLIKLL